MFCLSARIRTPQTRRQSFPYRVTFSEGEHFEGERGFHSTGDVGALRVEAAMRM